MLHSARHYAACNYLYVTQAVVLPFAVARHPCSHFSTRTAWKRAKKMPLFGHDLNPALLLAERDQASISLFGHVENPSLPLELLCDVRGLEALTEMALGPLWAACCYAAVPHPSFKDKDSA